MDPFLHAGFNTGTHPALVLSGLVKIRQQHELLELKCPSSMISCLEELISLLGKALERDPPPCAGSLGRGATGRPLQPCRIPIREAVAAHENLEEPLHGLLVAC